MFLTSVMFLASTHDGICVEETERRIRVTANVGVWIANSASIHCFNSCSFGAPWLFVRHVSGLAISMLYKSIRNRPYTSVTSTGFIHA